MVRRRLLPAIFICALTSAAVVPAGAARAGTPPEVNKDHWHAAFGIWNCGKWLDPVTAADDPIGIHTHGDGLIHVHPFDERAAGKNAILARFLDVTHVKVSASEVSITGRPTIKAGATCNGEKSVIRTLVWPTLKAKAPKVVTGDPGNVALVNGEVIAVVIGGPKANPGQPPSVAELVDPADLPLPELSAKEMAALPAAPAKPTFKASGAAPTKLTTTDLVVGTGATLTNGKRAYMRYVLHLWRTSETLDEGWSSTQQPYALARVGKNRNLVGLDKGMVGMKVGGVRRIVIPPADGFGPSGNGPIRGDDVIVFDVQLVAVAD